MDNYTNSIKPWFSQKENYPMPYIDGFVHPVPTNQIEKYRDSAAKIAAIWKEHGAIEYCEYVLDDAKLNGTRAFPEHCDSNDNEVVVFGWVKFESRAARDLANKKVSQDPRMTDLVAPLCSTQPPIFDAQRMIYGGFKALV